MSAYKVFISYIKEEAELANHLRVSLEELFGNRIEFFFFEEINKADVWEQAILNSLNECNAIFCLISPASIGKKWIILEFGAYWSARKEVYPLLHGNISPEGLYYPLSQYQCTRLSSHDDIVLLIQNLQKKVELRTLPSHFKINDFVSKTQEIIETISSRNFIYLLSVQDINKHCNLSLTDDSLIPLSFSESDVESMSQDLRGLKIINSGKTFLITGYVETSGAIKINLKNSLLGKNFLLIKAENTGRSKPRNLDKLFQVTLIHQTGKFLDTHGLEPFLDSHRHFDDTEYVYQRDSYFLYNIQGMISNAEPAYIELGFWKIHVKELRLSFFTV